MQVVKIESQKDGIYAISVARNDSSYEDIQSIIININSIDSIDVSNMSFIRINVNTTAYRIQFENKDMKEPFLKSLFRDINIDSILEK